jgi:cytochrome P450
MTQGQTAVFNPFIPSFKSNPYVQYARARDYAPIYHSDALNAWVITSHEACSAILKDPEIFSSNPRYASGAIANEVAREAEANPLGYVRNVLTSDPPDHTRLRAIVNKTFTPKRIAALDEHITDVTDSLVESLRTESKFDLMAGLAQPLPVIVIAEMLGIPPSERIRFKEWSTVVASATKLVPDPAELERRRVVTEEMVAYLGEIIDRRLSSPEDDLISAIVNDQDETGDKLTRDEAISFTILLLVAGNETTTNLIGNGMLALLNHHNVLDQIAANPDIIPSVIEETLRYDSPVQGLVRVATRNTEVLGTLITKGDVLMCMLGAANRDPAAYSDPDTFLFDRREKRHLSFGHGIHFCLGAPLARVEAGTAFKRLFEEFSSFAPVKGGLTRGGTLLLRGADELIISAEKRT